MEIYDIIHGNIIISPLAKKIIDTEEFQRLRNIKQLGCCNFVFPSATHTRFEHSIGVYHLSCKYIDILNRKKVYYNETERKCITLAALIHDLGHGPYSHLFDELFEKEKNHEYRSGELLRVMNKKYNFELNDNEIQLICNIIEPKNINIPKEKKYIYQIVSNSNGIDVDRFDYIMRDIKMTGLNYGIEYERIMNHSFIINNEIVFSEKVKTNINDFFRIRYIMYKEVYNHRTVRGIEFMMKDFIKIYSNVFNLEEIISKGQWDKFIQLNDSIIYSYINNEDKEKSEQMKDIISNIMSRNIYKSVGEIISKEKFIKNISYQKEKIIIDQIIINLNDYEDCNYYQKKNIINTIINEGKEKLYILRIYSKKEEYIKYGDEIFNLLLQ